MNPDKINLICLPFAGGNINSYKGFKNHFSDQFNIINIEFPGRGSRIKESLLFTIEQIAEDVFSQLQHQLDKPYAIYGHSMGSLIAYEVCKRIAEKGLPKPLHLFVSGKSGPSAQLDYIKMHDLPVAVFWKRVKEMGGIPQAILNEPELMNYFEPILRADLKAVEEYNYQNNKSAFDFPITVMIGKDEDITDENANLWQKETTHQLHFYKFPGNHFFIFNNYPQLAKLMMEKLQALIL